ncbi:MAG TPA: sulfite dehydrogenase [Caulobacteraceae bacterium]|jgi:sulfane dehydrogenase subunit SoxC
MESASLTSEDLAAGGGLLHRRTLLSGGLLALGAAKAVQAQTVGSQSIGAVSPPTMTTPGAPFSAYGVPSHWRAGVKRVIQAAPGRTGTGVSRTPLEQMEGTLTAAGLHFERHHNGVPDIAPDKHTLTIYGLVKRPLTFSLDTLMRYPMESHIRFVECAGNSGGLTAPQPAQVTAGVIHGLLSGSEWTGVPLAILLQEAGVDPRAKWILAEGADAAGMSRSVPLWKAMQDAMIALYQNGEAIRPEQGFPMRLLLPGFQGNTNVKWLRRLKLIQTPMFTKDETSRYTELMPDGKAREFMLQMGVKSVITRPSFGLTMQGPGVYEISGLAWSGGGRIAKVEVSADGGKSWAQAALGETILPRALSRFRLPWMWSGEPALLLSRATDEKGERQPTRAQWLARYAPGQTYHFNGITAWQVQASGQVSHAYA